MSLYKPDGTDRWYVSVTLPSGKRVRRSTGTTDKREAQEYHDRLKADAWRVAKLGDKPSRTFDEIALRWLTEAADKRSIEGDKLKIKRLRPHFKKLQAHQITAEHCREAVDASQGKVPFSNATRNRYLALLRAMLNKAEKDWLWIDKAPHISMNEEPEGRVRWLTPQEVQTLMRHLPEHLVPIVNFALATGLRKSNVYGLRWDQIDMQRHVAWVHPEDAKAGQAIGVPLNQTAIDAIRSQLGKHNERVFTYRGEPLTGEHNEGLYRAYRDAGIKGANFHTLRHTWASWLVQSGISLAKLQELGGWKSFAMVRRYAHLSVSHLHDDSRMIDKMLSKFCQSEGADKEKRAALAR